MLKRCSECRRELDPAEFRSPNRRSECSQCCECRKKKSQWQKLRNERGRIRHLAGDPPVTEKLCPRCGVTKPISEFHKRSARSIGVQTYCKTCAYTEYIAKRPEVRAKRSQWAQRWQRNNPERVKEIENKKRSKQSWREWRRNYERSYREKNPEYRRGLVKDWEKRHPGKRAEISNRYRAAKAGAPGWFTAEEFAALKRKHDNSCLACGRKEGEVKLVADHVIPLGKEGSTNWIANIQPLCNACNARKGKRTIDYRPKK